MEHHFAAVTELTAQQHGVVGLSQLVELGVAPRRRRWWEERGLLHRVGPKSLVLVGSVATWHQQLWVAHFGLDGRGYFAGRTGCRLHGLDGFKEDHVEVLARRERRSMVIAGATLRTTDADLDDGDTVTIDGLRCLRVERLILDAPQFGFSRSELENAIDSGIRLRKVSERRLRAAVTARHDKRLKGSRLLVEAMVDTGGESQLERRFLALVRSAGLPRPELQRVYREGSRTLARVDAVFPGGNVVEVEGHATHSSRQQRAADERRRNLLIARGATVRVFTHPQVTREGGYVIGALKTFLPAVA